MGTGTAYKLTISSSHGPLTHNLWSTERRERGRGVIASPEYLDTTIEETIRGKRSKVVRGGVGQLGY